MSETKGISILCILHSDRFGFQAIRALLLYTCFSLGAVVFSLAFYGGPIDAVIFTPHVAAQPTSEQELHPTDLDLIFANIGEANQRCRNDGHGGFTCSEISNHTYPSYAVAAAELNGQEGLDLVFANYGTASQLCLNAGPATFICDELSSGVTQSLAVTAVDLDGRYTADLVFANYGWANRVCLSLGQGAFSCSDVSEETNSTNAVVAADLDGRDGLDLIFANEGDGNRVCLNDGGGAFTCTGVSDDRLFSTGVAVTDLDAQAGPDLIFSNLGAANHVCLNDGTGSFRCADVASDTSYSTAVVVSDVDGRSGPDLVFANYGRTHLLEGEANQLCLNAGNATFTCSVISQDTNPSGGVDVAELDGSPGVDLVFANAGTVNRVCFNDGSGAFSCENVSSEVNLSGGVVIGSFADHPLSVELLDFVVIPDHDGVHLHWQTASETNNAGFEIQHRVLSLEAEGQLAAWQVLGFVDGYGTTLEEHRYQFTTHAVTAGNHQFRLKQIDFDGTFVFSPAVDVRVEASRRLTLAQNTPNPFNWRTEIRFTVPSDEHALLTVYNLLGQQVATLYDGQAQAGREYRLGFDAQALPPGSYLYTLESKDRRLTKSLVLMK